MRKGMAMSGGILYVADITVVGKFDAKTGAPKGDIAVEGATFLNDVPRAPRQEYVSDTGVKGREVRATGTDAVLRHRKRQVKPVAKMKVSGAPRSSCSADGVLVVTFGSGELYRLDTRASART